jgi:hypothetical protein
MPICSLLGESPREKLLPRIIVAASRPREMYLTPSGSLVERWSYHGYQRRVTSESESVRVP